MVSLGMVVRGSFKAMKVSLRNLFRSPITVMYPQKRRPVPRSWRAGGFALTYDPETGEENCIGCRLCEFICPSQIISVTMIKGEKRKNGKGATYAKSFTLNFQACMQCELCVQVCPTDAIVMLRELHTPTFSRDDLFYTKEKLLENGRKALENPELLSFTTGERLREWTDPQKGASR